MTWPLFTAVVSLAAIEVAWYGVTRAIHLEPLYGLSGMFGIALVWPRYIQIADKRKGD